ncbi:MAG: TetR/AcrR family transcriptional regulator [Woeseiaceae bacterium]|nr:TetR/AcrR family transcriptional regulator [Woeseiaceae bacterium]
MSEKVDMLMQRLDVTRKGAQRIADILEAGVDILREQGFTALTKRRIAKRLGISDGNVGYYFPTRESLWAGVIDYEVKTYYDRQYAGFTAPLDDADARFDEFVRSWFKEYEDRDLRIFFAQLLAFAEVSPFVAQQRDEIYEMYYRETLDRIRALAPGVGEDELQRRTSLVVALLEGLHAVTGFKPELMRSGAVFADELVEQAKAIATGRK